MGMGSVPGFPKRKVGLFVWGFQDPCAQFLINFLYRSLSSHFSIYLSISRKRNIVEENPNYEAATSNTRRLSSSRCAQITIVVLGFNPPSTNATHTRYVALLYSLESQCMLKTKGLALLYVVAPPYQVKYLDSSLIAANCITMPIPSYRLTKMPKKRIATLFRSSSPYFLCSFERCVLIQKG